MQFGDLLRRNRLAVGLTQEALAERAGLSLRGVSDLERGERNAPHRDTVLRLAAALQVDEAGRDALLEAARRPRRAEDPAPPLPTISSTALPVQLSSFVGRTREMVRVRQRLGSTRLLTLTGPGGSGKTRLAIQVAAAEAAGFKDGAVFVSLASISDPELVAPTIAQALGIQDTGGRPLLERLNDYLQGKTVLLVLDNFEQVVAAAPLVSQLLSASSGLKVVVTSREPLRLQGEHEFEVPPLELPDDCQRLSVTDLATYGAVALFVERAAAIKSDFALTDDNASAVVEICRRLDGLPLAIELAAARIRFLAPPELLTRLARRLALLTGGVRDLPVRQQTLRATVAWSYGLLDERERALFRRLSVFVGGCTLEAAESLVADHIPEVLDAISSLVAKNLIRQEDGPDGVARLVMLETVREYGLEQLEAHGEAELVRQQHARYFLALAEAAEPKLLGSEQVTWTRRLAADHDNLRTVLSWSRDGLVDGTIGLRLAGALEWFWALSGVAREARGWAESVLALPAGGARTRARARALLAAARIATLQDDTAAARAFADESVAIFREVGDLQGAGRALLLRAVADTGEGNVGSARALLDSSITLARRVGDVWGLAFALSQLGAVAREEGDYQAARRLREESAMLAQRTGDRIVLGLALAGLADLARLRGEREEAEHLFSEALSISAELGPFWRVVPRALSGLAGIARLSGDNVRSARLFGAAAAVWEASGKRELANWRTIVDADVADVHASLGDEPFAAAWAEGHAMRIEEALSCAFEAVTDSRRTD